MAGEEAARALIGARFRLHGRDRASGVDCVGVAAAALGLDAVPSGYALRGGREDLVMALLDAAAARCGGERPGDVMLFRVGPGQLHLGVRTIGGIVHADAGLRRVVERPGVPPWAVIGAWRRP